MRKFNGFTLAEVLITLGIIGVVAAMTMPTLINQTNGAQYKAAYKKALSAISQGVTLNVALDDISFADTVAGTAGSIAKDTSGNTTIASLLASRMNVVKNAKAAELSSAYKTAVSSVKTDITCTSSGTDDTECTGDDTTKSLTIKPDTFLFFNDSSMFAFKSSDEKCTNTSTTGTQTICYGIIDVNGEKGPNKLVSCDTKATGDKSTNCNVTSPTDIYPVKFYDQTILPATTAAEAVLYGK